MAHMGTEGLNFFHGWAFKIVCARARARVCV